MLERKEVSLADLLLDPANPRLRSMVGGNIGEVPDADVEGEQEALLQQLRGVREDTYALKDLMASFRRVGYQRIDRIVVRPLAGSDKYLVVEGNRRTAAAKLLLRQDGDEANSNKRLKEEVRNSLESIEVQVLDTANRSKEEIADYINVVLGIRHYGSLLEWSPLAKAHNIFEEYMRGLDGTDEFSFKNSRVEEVADQLSVGRNAIRRALRGYLAFRQIDEISDDVKPRHFSLVEEFVNNASLKNSLVVVDDRTFRVDETSLAQIVDLCEFDTRDKDGARPRLRRPQSVRTLGRLVSMAEGDEDESTRNYARSRLNELIAAEGAKVLDVETAYAQARSFKKRRKWLESIQELLKTLEEQGLNAEEFLPEGNALMHKEALEKQMNLLKAVLQIN